ncbi:MAG: aldo/keto reductase [Clostridia bacterium]|nr:aldo/keto reductase [Clostridia bacterium]
MFKEVHKNFGFGCMRLPMKDGEIDYAEFNKMVDTFISNGFNYFDTAHGYHDGKSETALRDCLVKRYPRDKFILTDKLTNFYFKTEEEVRPFFESQLKICGVDYFDFYLMHAQSKENFAMFKHCKAYEQALQFKAEGKIKHFGISFHDTAEVLEQILTEYPQVEVVQIQLNYVDFDDPAVQSKKCYEVCRKFNKPVIVMEPVKGGNLVNLPKDAQKYFDELGNASAASYAIRFAAGFDGIFMVLSGMSNMAQMNDNISYMKDFKPLDEREMKAVHNVCNVFKAMNLIACTACGYCTAGCPKGISIPDLFACLNTKNIYHDWNADYYYNEVHTKYRGKASHCVKCGKCEKACPQHLPIRKLLESVAKEFEKC